MSEFDEKYEALKEGMKEHLFTAPLDEGEMNDGGTSDSVNQFISDADDGGDDDHSPQEVQKKNERSEKKRDRLKDKVSRYAYENQVLKAQKIDIEAQKRALEEERRQLHERISQQEQYANLAYATNVGIREDSLLRDLETAQEEGEFKRAAYLQKELAELSASKQTQELYNTHIKPQQDFSHQSNYQNPYQQQAYNEQAYEQIQQQPYANDQASEVIEEFMDSNPWSDPNSPHYDRSLTQEFSDMATEYDKILRYEGRSSEIGDHDYFQLLKGVMDKKYGIQPKGNSQSNDYDDDDSEQNIADAYQQQNRPHVAPHQYAPVSPVGRAGGTMSDRYISQNPNKTRNSIQLSATDMKFIENLQVPHPSGLRNLTRDEVRQRYIESVKSFQNDKTNKINVPV